MSLSHSQGWLSYTGLFTGRSTLLPKGDSWPVLLSVVAGKEFESGPPPTDQARTQALGSSISPGPDITLALGENEATLPL